MLYSGIDEIFQMLSWNASNEVQLRGIAEASKIKHLSVLIMPVEDKTVWENCAKVLVSKSDQELQPYFYKLFEWLQDMTWPGAYLIYDRLKTVPPQVLMSAYEYSLSASMKMNDEPWKASLNDFYKDYVM